MRWFFLTMLIAYTAACTAPRLLPLSNLAEFGTESSLSLKHSFPDLGWEFTVPNDGWHSTDAWYGGVHGRKFRLQGTSSITVFIGMAFKHQRQDVFDVMVGWKLYFYELHTWYVHGIRMDKEGRWSFHVLKPLNGITLINGIHGIPIPSHPDHYFLVVVSANEAEYHLCQVQVRLMIRSLRALSH